MRWDNTHHLFHLSAAVEVFLNNFLNDWAKIAVLSLAAILIFCNKFVKIRINVVPPDILLAQKILYIVKRKRPMGRDFYDAIFLLEKTKPNIEFLKLKLDIKDSMDLKNKIPLQYDINNYPGLFTSRSHCICFVAAQSRW